MIIEFQPPCYVQGHQPADQAAQSHIQPGLDGAGSLLLLCTVNASEYNALYTMYVMFCSPGTQAACWDAEHPVCGGIHALQDDMLAFCGLL